jgi:hypothetical protein
MPYNVVERRVLGSQRCPTQQESSQNLILDPSPRMKEPLAKKFSLAFMRPFQKGESIGLLVTWDKVLECKYLLWMICCQTTFSLISLKSHLLNKHLFFNSRTSIPKPPWSFGLQIKFHFVRRYFFLWPSHCQKNQDQKKSSLFLTPLGSQKRITWTWVGS